MRIATAQVWVRDQDEALAFYTDKLGMVVRSDVTVPAGTTPLRRSNLRRCRPV